MPWGVAAAGVAAGGSIIGGLIGGNSQSKDIAANEKLAINLGQQNANQTDLLNQYYVASGNNALTDIADASGSNGVAGQDYASSLFQTDPGYQFDLTQGEKAQDNGAAARGLGTSGANIQGETNYAEGLADNAYSSFYNRLSSLAGMGQTAIGQDANAGAQAASGAAQTAASAGAAQAGITGTQTSGITSALNSFLNNATTQNALSAYASPTTKATGDTQFLNALSAN
ncbi:hypothetical protein [Acidisoma silvae]|uniref:DNA transfer protein n=1 Tax=Acidisoma silvae TaxID=2802396 RepID=A0A964E172_9PROT|nr:hypothetical protein [Acidisoma silvae]MCB8878280.1 hypothetical protein [Acidisoma silvae]